MSNCRFPQDIDDLINKYKSSCDKSDYKKLSMLVHPDRNPAECRDDANKHFSNLNSSKMRCERGFQPGCKYRTAGLNISEIGGNPDKIQDMLPDTLMSDLLDEYKNKCNGDIYSFLNKYLDQGENQNCEEKASEHRKELEDIFNTNCNKPHQPEPQRRRPAGEPEPQRRRPAPQQPSSPEPQRRRPSPQQPEPQRRRPSPQQPSSPEPQRRRPSPQQPSSPVSPQRRQSPQLTKRPSSKRSHSKSPTVVKLRAEAKKLGCRGYSKLTKAELIKFIKKCKKSPTSTVAKLKAEAKKLGCKGYSKLTKAELVKFVKKCAK
jgi:arsenate reductase-like glutaredoxin family protein